MKILHVIDSSGIYGAEMVLLNLMHEQQQMGFIPILGSISEFNHSESPLELGALNKGLQIKRLQMRRGYNVAGALRLIRFAIGQKIDLFHSHGYKPNILLGSLPRWFRKKPVVSTLHGWTSIKKSSKIWLYEGLDRLCLRRIDAVVQVASVPSDTRNSKSLKGLNLCVVENGIPSLSFDVDAPIRKDSVIGEFCEDNFVIGAIGRLSAEKGPTYLIEAMSLLLLDREDYRLVIIGEGDQRDQLERRIQKRKLADKVLFTGYREIASNYLSLFEVFVLPSLTEGLPITLLEAMQAGTPIVATRVGGVPEVLGNGRYGTLVEPKNPKALADAISYVREHPDIAREMAQRAKEVVLGRYSSRRMAEDYSRIYEWVLKNWDAKKGKTKK